jgi:anti-sigma B factor antagonist
MSACPLIVITAALRAWAALPVIFRGGSRRLRCHQGRSILAGRRHAHRRLRVQGKTRLRPDPAKLVISVGRALARRTVIVALPEQIDVTNAAGVAEQLTSAVSCHPAVLIDMTATRFCDCAGARAIMRAYTRATDSGAELRLVVTTEPVRRIFSLIGVDRLLEVYPSVEAACGDGRRLVKPGPGKPRSRPSEKAVQRRGVAAGAMTSGFHGRGL